MPLSVLKNYLSSVCVVNIIKEKANIWNLIWTPFTWTCQIYYWKPLWKMTLCVTTSDPTFPVFHRTTGLKVFLLMAWNIFLTPYLFYLDTLSYIEPYEVRKRDYNVDLIMFCLLHMMVIIVSRILWTQSKYLVYEAKEGRITWHTSVIFWQWSEQLLLTRSVSCVSCDRTKLPFNKIKKKDSKETLRI